MFDVETDASLGYTVRLEYAFEPVTVTFSITAVAVDEMPFAPWICKSLGEPYASGVPFHGGFTDGGPTLRESRIRAGVRGTYVLAMATFPIVVAQVVVVSALSPTTHALPSTGSMFA